MSQQDLERAKQLSTEGQQDQAIELFRQLIEQRSQVNDAHLGIGVALLRKGQYREAGDYLRDCQVDVAEIHMNAALAYRQCQDEQEEWDALIRVVQTRQRVHEEPYRRLAQWAVGRKIWPAAYEALMLLSEMNTEDLPIVLQLANTCKEMRRLGQAVTYYLNAYHRLEDEDQRTSLHFILAGLYKDMGQQAQAYQHFQQAYQRSPSPGSCSNLIMAAQYTHGVDLQSFYKLCQEYSARFLQYKRHHQHDLDRLDPDRIDTGLTIGFVSGDFVAHSLTNLLLEPFRRFKDLAPQHRFICYSSREQEREDQYSEAYKQAVHDWRCIHGLTDEQAAQQIVDDRVDILIDLAGHTGYNRLPIFGYKPAPVQAGWVSGMMTPSALETINYFMTDQWIRPECADEICQERLFNLPAAYTYFPLTTDVPVQDLPADRNQYLTFGSFNNPCKIHDQTIDTWSRCLQAVPNSRMHIKVYTKATEQHIQRQMAQNGVSSDRLQFVYNLPTTADVMRYYTSQIDLVLDTWPCAGCLTSAEALWMGCPVVTLLGQTFLHRQTWTLCCQLGLEDLAAQDLDQYVQAAKDWASDLDRLREFRRTIRDRMEQAPVRDPQAVGQGVIDACHYFWTDWCDSRQALKEVQSIG
jgi:predicted O-linked N-acetylglucosamine transferase (SPINDLY family)